MFTSREMGAPLLLALGLTLLTAQGEGVHPPNKPGYRPVLKSQGEGNPNGTVFDDLLNITATIVNIRSIAIISMYQVDYLQLTYVLENGSLCKSPEHGDGLFNPETIALEKDEHIEKIEGTTSFKMINQLTFTISRPSLSQKRVVGPYGTTVGTHSFVFEGYIIGFHGKTGMLLQNLGVYYMPLARATPYFGHPPQNFIEDPDAIHPPVVKVAAILIWHGDGVNWIQMKYRLLGGGWRAGQRHPADCKMGRLTTIMLRENEWLIGAHGILKTTQLQSLSFVTRKRDGSRGLYGPYGNRNETDSTTKFAVTGTIIGYRGYTGTTGLESVGFFYH